MRRQLEEQELEFTKKAIERSKKMIQRLQTHQKYLQLAITEMLPLNFEIQLEEKTKELAKTSEEINNEQRIIEIYNDQIINGVETKEVKEENAS